MRKIYNTINKNLVYNKKDYFLKVVTNRNNKNILLVFYKKDGYEKIIYKLVPNYEKNDNSYIFDLETKKFKHKIFSNDSFCFDDYYNLIKKDFFDFSNNFFKMLNKNIIIYTNNYYKYMDDFENNMSPENEFQITMKNCFILKEDFKFASIDSTILLITKNNIKIKLKKDYKKDLVNKLIAEPLNKRPENVTFNDIKLINLLSY